MKRALPLTLIVLTLFIALGALRDARADEPAPPAALTSARAAGSLRSAPVAPAHGVEEGRTVVLSTSAEGMMSAPADAFLPPVSLTLDDGTAEDTVGRGSGGDFIWLNRFTPAAGFFPITLQQVQVAFSVASDCAVGDLVDIYIYSDADGNPANGATHRASITGQTIQGFGNWSTYPTNVTLNGPGDVLIGVVNRDCILAGQYPAAIDMTASRGRSWFGFNNNPPGPMGNPPLLPTTLFGKVDDFDMPGNWMIRGLGQSSCTVGCPTATPPPPATATPTPEPFPNVSLILDDGTVDEGIGLTKGGELIWLNRFTPPAASYPFTLRQVRLFVDGSSICAVGDAIDIYLYQDADGNPANGATHVASITGQTIQALNGWSTYPTTVPLTGPGDVLIGVVSRDCLYPDQYPATLDRTASQGRSWIGFNPGPVGDPPVIPSSTFGTIDYFGYTGNWMLRGFGERCSGPCPTPPPSPTPTVTPTPTPLPAGTYCATPNVWIPDNNTSGITSTIQVPHSGAVGDVDVFVDAPHTWVGDLGFTLTHNSISTILIDRPLHPLFPDGCARGDIRALLDDEAEEPIESQCNGSAPAIEGSFTPERPLSIFSGAALGGTWTIRATDAQSGGVGRLRQWCVSFEAMFATYLPFVVR